MLFSSMNKKSVVNARIPGWRKILSSGRKRAHKLAQAENLDLEEEAKEVTPLQEEWWNE